MLPDIVAVAHIAWEAYRALCVSQGDHTVDSWYFAPDDKKQAMIASVSHIILTPGITAKMCHEHWVRWKLHEGWTSSNRKDEARKTHPMLMAWDDLTPDQQLKDRLFVSIVQALYPAYD